MQTLGVAQAAKGELAAAISSFRQALKIGPGDPLVSLKLAELLRVEGDLASATTVVAEAAELHPDNPAITTYLARLKLQEGSRVEAIDMLRETLQRNPSEIKRLRRLSASGVSIERRRT